MKLLRTEHYFDSEGDPAIRKYYQADDGQQYVIGPGYMLPCNENGEIFVPPGDATVRVVNYTMTYEAKAKGA